MGKNNKKIDVVRRRQTQADDLDFERLSEKASNGGGQPSSATSDGPTSPGGHNDDARFEALLDSHQRNVNAQVDECRQFVMHSMDKIMNVLEQRLTDVNQHQQAYP